jgi:ferrochelatase
LDPYDGVLLVSFGGPEGPEDVMPFLRNVVRGRAVPQRRLEEVAAHYRAFGGRSPINDANRVLRAGLERELGERGVATPVLWGNRNWHPLLPETLRRAHAAGHRRIVAVLTSAYSSYSGCRMYRENVADAVAEVAAEGHVVGVDVVRPYGRRPALVEAAIDAVAAGLRGLEHLSEEAGRSARVVFVTHSVPQAMDAASGPAGFAYSGQHLEVARAVMGGLATRWGRTREWDLVYCSRSGPPHQPWLEPDINDHLLDLAKAGVTGVVAAPIGFLSDHMEVVYDLDTEAADLADRLGLPFVRVPTVGTDPRCVATMADAVLDRARELREGLAVDPGGMCGDGCCRT